MAKHNEFPKSIFRKYTTAPTSSLRLLLATVTDKMWEKMTAGVALALFRTRKWLVLQWAK